ncbi:glycoside hydrolase/phage tail family protein [uncultured Litoreibacter sp.]|uniref:baseplate multidomain protein megatron n=1 Tax=uncultured Litoreibacter sp. TaxID=1392394 RepID=UPI00262C9268|nr:glycoside hydrolase/phage tail family protein [uncultured Litoreibacter sp.]
MATILLSAAGAAIGGAIGGGVLGLSSVVIGRAIGATIGRAIDQSLMGTGSQTVETGKLDRMRIMGASEGGAVPRVFGRTRVAGNVIWTSNYRETVTAHRSGGKGAPKGPTTHAYSYSISLAIALCEGEIARVGRVWADGAIVNRDDLNMQVYRGTEDQLPDPVMSAIEGDGQVPAYRGIAYVVFEDLPLEAFGNRVPQFSFEVLRPAQPEFHNEPSSIADLVEGVALLPGSGEYALATTPVFRPNAAGAEVAVNQNSQGGQVDIVASLEALTGELPRCKSTSLVVSWFGDDLRAGHCRCQPKVEEAAPAEIGSSLLGVGSRPADEDGENSDFSAWVPEEEDRHPWIVGGATRAQAEVVGKIDGRPVYGGTPSDASVIEAIAALHDAGQDVMFYPFLLMEVLDGNSLPDPWTGSTGQPALPWRGRITSERAPGIAQSTDQTAAARTEVAAFMGSAVPADFTINGQQVTYDGPEEYSYRRFILHYAHLCAAAGGVSAFCIGSEMRGLTQLRDETGSFPAVEAFRQLAAEVKAILPGAKVGYAADWTEYFGYHPQDGTGDVLFHLDPLWADDAIDFIGIDNYMPIADWRADEAQADAAFGSIYNLDYLSSNVAGGEGFDWYYRDQQERDLQIRTPISDGAYGEDWIYRFKDLKGWWQNAHHDRIGGVRSSVSTAWVPSSKPFWMTELGCGAIDKGPNQPNKFFDAKSSESGLPHYSNGRRDDYVQLQFLRAYHDHFADIQNNPVSTAYGGSMVDVSKTHIWAWDARPWPDFPNNTAVWSDGENHLTGHWLTGRTGVQTLASVVAELCEAAGVTQYDVSALEGVLRGFTIDEFETGRASLQTLMVAFGFDVIEQGGALIFRNRGVSDAIIVGENDYVRLDGEEAALEAVRAPQAEVVGEVRLGYAAGEGAFETHVASARFPDDTTALSSQNDLPLSLNAAEARGIAERWLAEARVARETVRLALPPSRSEVGAGDVIALSTEGDVLSTYRVDRVEDSGPRLLEASRIERQIYTPSEGSETLPEHRAFSIPVPITTQFMDLPLLTGNEVPHAPHVAVSADPWPGSAAVYGASNDADYDLDQLIERPSILGVTQSPLDAAAPGLWCDGPVLRVVLQRGTLSSSDRARVLNGANAAVIGDGSSSNWEVIQFATAELVAPQTYDLSGFLRGQAGSDGIMPTQWPAGSTFVMLDGAPQQLDLQLAQRELARHYRVGPGLRPLDDPAFRHYVEAFGGVGLRPFSPAHLRVVPHAGGWDVGWIRRTRIDGDSWASVDVPLGEDFERYLVRVVKDEVVLHEAQVASPEWSYPAATALAEGAVAPFEIQIAQVSQSFGPGPFARKIIHV